VTDPDARQRSYYARTAQDYDRQHGGEPEHVESLRWFSSSVAGLGGSVRLLDVGAGTGRTLEYLRAHWASGSFVGVGVEPVQALREVARSKGIELSAGDARHLDYPDESFDFVTAVGVLHHVREPQSVVSEMLRVARTGIFISDSNCYGQGSTAARLVKCGLRFTGLWRPFNFVRTRGRVFHESEGDGVFYSFSVFDVLPQIKRVSPQLRLFQAFAQANPRIWSGPHAAVLGLKRLPSTPSG
jgi:SAM-dependent methyltransferase